MVKNTRLARRGTGRDGCGRLLAFQAEQVLERNTVRSRNGYQRCDRCVGRALFHSLQVLGVKANDFSCLLLAQATSEALSKKSRGLFVRNGPLSAAEGHRPKNG